jgi:hypothetical protein
VFGVGFGTFGNMRNAVTLVALLWEAVRVNGVRSKLPLHGGVAVTGEVIYLGRGRGSAFLVASCWVWGLPLL